MTSPKATNRVGEEVTSSRRSFQSLQSTVHNCWTRQLVRNNVAALVLSSCLLSSAASIDRHALVIRHNPVLHEFDPLNPFTVGNGEFAFTADATGLQTFPEAFEHTTPLGTLSHWGWHTIPNTNGWSIDNFQFTEFESHGRKVPYADVPRNLQTAEIKWLRSNPHRLHLGKVGLLLKKSDGASAQISDLSQINQTLDLWDGELVSHFIFEGSPVEVHTICHFDLDVLAVSVTSPLLAREQCGIDLHFPYGTGETITADWKHPDAHETKMSRRGESSALFERSLDNDHYYAAAHWSSNAVLSEAAPHRFLLMARRGATNLEFTCGFSPKLTTRAVPDFAETERASRQHWNAFWTSGGAIDLSRSKDPRWHELERRIVLSQYLTAIQCAGSLPPQETGLTYNSWEGKFHLEMHWWHAAHFALWGRAPMLEKSLRYYDSILPRAQGTAQRQGYTGARWPKMTDPNGAESPSPVGPFLIWQEPHPIFYAELCYRSHPNPETLKRFEPIVSNTAEFMASYAFFDSAAKRYVLGPPLQCSQEIFPRERTMNPTFELTYWRWGLQIAQRWRERMHLARFDKWDKIVNQLAMPATEDGKYLFAETATGTYTDKKWVKDHPSVLAALGMLPGVSNTRENEPCIVSETMRATSHWIWDNWNWKDTWGWDYPMVAMCAARLGEPDRAIDALLLDAPKNHYGINGHNYQRPGLSIYLPGNGGLLYATAMMAGGWDGGPRTNTPGFPTNGDWLVSWEGLRRAP